MHHATGFLLCVLCVCRCQFARSGRPLFRPFGCAYLSAGDAHTNDFLEFPEKSEISNASVAVRFYPDGHW